MRMDQRTEYGYDEAGNLITQTDANGHVTQYEYDGVGRRIATVLPLGQRSTTTYDAVGNVATTTDFNGQETTYEYDDEQSAAEQDSSRTPPRSSFTYTANGQRETVVDARGTTSYEYDVRDRLVSRTDPDGATIAYTYDAAGNRLAVTTEIPGIDPRTTSYTFDALNRLATVTDPEDLTTTYTYDAVSNLVQTQYPNATLETREYDDLNRLVFLENTTALQA